MAVLDDLPPELLTLIAGHLVTPFTHIPLFPGTFERAPDASGQLAFTPADDEITARHAVEASDLGQLRLVSRIWEETATPWLYARVRVARVERLELLLSAEANRLCRCVRWLDILAAPLYERAAIDDSHPEPGCVLAAVLARMPGLEKLSLQAPLPHNLLDSLTVQERPLHVDLLTSLAVVIQTTKYDDPDFLSSNSRSIKLSIPATLPFLTKCRHLRTLHVSGCFLTPSDVTRLLVGLADAGIQLEIISVGLASGAQDQGPLSQRLEVLRSAGEFMGRSLREVRFVGTTRFMIESAPSASDWEIASLANLQELHLGVLARGSGEGIILRVFTEGLIRELGLELKKVFWEEQGDHDERVRVACYSQGLVRLN